MPGAVCKVIIDSGRYAAAAAYASQMTAATATMIDEAIGRGVLAANDPKVATINEKLCYWAEKLEAWNSDLFKLASEVAAQPPAGKKASNGA